MLVGLGEQFVLDQVGTKTTRMCVQIYAAPKDPVVSGRAP